MCGAEWHWSCECHYALNISPQEYSYPLEEEKLLLAQGKKEKKGHMMNDCQFLKVKLSIKFAENLWYSTLSNSKLIGSQRFVTGSAASKRVVTF